MTGLGDRDQSLLLELGPFDVKGAVLLAIMILHRFQGSDILMPHRARRRKQRYTARSNKKWFSSRRTSCKEPEATARPAPVRGQKG